MAQNSRNIVGLLVVLFLALVTFTVENAQAQYGMTRGEACGLLCDDGGLGYSPPWYGSASVRGARCQMCDPGCCCCRKPNCWHPMCG